MRLEAEWLETNGTGGFACGTVGGELRRKWHGLLWVARKPPRDRVRVVAGAEEFLHGPDGPCSLSALWREGTWRAPQMPPTFDPFPTPHWQWSLGEGVELRRQLLMSDGTTDRVTIAWRLDAPKGSRLGLSLRLVFPSPPTVDRVDANTLRLGDFAGVPLYLHADGPLRMQGGDEALHDVLLETEKDCEKVWRETLFASTEIFFEVTSDEPFALCISPDPEGQPGSFEELYRAECERRCLLPLPRIAGEHARHALRLARAADQFIVRAGDRGLRTIMAGYPWFTDWGRDTMISLPGLCLATGRDREAHDIMRHFLDHMDCGIIPNIFPESGTAPMYNTIDATLWLVEAYFRCVPASAAGDHPQDWERLRQVVESHLGVTHNDIGLEKDGLLRGGGPGSQLTWMDVKVNGEVPTPRHGKPVEIQGLWYNALRLMGEAALAMGDLAFEKQCVELATRCAESFAKRFVDPAKEQLADVVDRDGPGTADWAIRPNMVIPFGLRHNIIRRERRAAVLRCAARELLTPRGLRSLAPSDPAYKPHYRGEVLERDRAYHQGTAWLWLAGPYYKGVHEERALVPELFAAAPTQLAGLLEHFENEACQNQCSEIFDGNPPHTPRGCYAQAWSVAALLEILSLDWEG